MSLSKLMKKRGKENWTIRRVAELVAELVAEAVCVCECENETNRRCHHCYYYYTVFLQVCVYNCNHIHDDYRGQNHSHRRINYRKTRLFLF